MKTLKDIHAGSARLDRGIFSGCSIGRKDDVVDTVALRYREKRKLKKLTTDSDGLFGPMKKKSLGTDKNLADTDG